MFGHTLTTTKKTLNNSMKSRKISVELNIYKKDTSLDMPASTSLNPYEADSMCGNPIPVNVLLIPPIALSGRTLHAVKCSLCNLYIEYNQIVSQRL